MEITKKLIDYFSKYGIYNEEERCLYLDDNKHLKIESLLENLKTYKIKVQLELFN